MTSLSGVLTRAREFNLARLSERQRARLWTGLELGLIAVWAMWVAAPYLDVRPTVWPAGTGMGIKLLGHHFWTTFQQCGLCALWNGTQNGGRPAMADLFGSQFHPLVIVTTLLWGVMGGAKIAIVVIMALAGVAQWWLARLLKLSRIAGLFTAGIAVAGGHLATKNDEGNFGLMLATVMCSLAIAAVLAVALHRRRRDTVILAIIGALVIIAGQGYMQFTLAAWAPALLIFWRREPSGRRPFWREVLLAVGLAVLLAGVIVIPTIHYWPNFTKDTVDTRFEFSEPLEYIPLNLVIRDYAFFQSGGVLGRQPNTDLQFIGWIPVLLALVSVRYIRRFNARPLLFLWAGAFLSMFIGSAIPLRWLGNFFPVLLGLRFTSPMPGLAVPPILALAGYGLDRLWRLKLPRLEVGVAGAARGSGLQLDVKWVLPVLLLIALSQVFTFARGFIHTQDMSDLYAGLASMQTPQTEWITPVWGETQWVEPALANNLKVTNIIYSGSTWGGRDLPLAYLQVFRDGVPEGGVPDGDLLGIPKFRLPANEYAYVLTPAGEMIPCQATAIGGQISVACAAATAGQLVVHEYTYSGWQAWRDGEASTTPLLGASWLTVDAPAGEHTYRFNYLPADVLVGLVLSLVGLVALVLVARTSDQLPPAAAASVAPAA